MLEFLSMKHWFATIDLIGGGKENLRSRSRNSRVAPFPRNEENNVVRKIVFSKERKKERKMKHFLAGICIIIAEVYREA